MMQCSRGGTMSILAMVWLILKFIAALGIVALGLFVCWFIACGIYSEISLLLEMRRERRKTPPTA